jgi:ATP-dependent Clp protease ATP-binding subunit ClpX
MDNIELRFTDDALDFIVEKAVEHKLGARGLRSIIETILTDSMFELPSRGKVKKLTVNKQFAEEKFNKSKLSHLLVA